jgi:hypothetical protein
MKTRKEFLEAVTRMANLKDLKEADSASTGSDFSYKANHSRRIVPKDCRGLTSGPSPGMGIH